MNKRLIAILATVLLAASLAGTPATWADPQSPLAPAEPPAGPPDRPAPPKPPRERPAARPALFDGDGDRVIDSLDHRLRGAGADQRVDVIVELHAPGGLATHGPELRRAAGPFTAYAEWDAALNGFAARLTPGQVRALARHPLVKRVDEDRPVHAFLDRAKEWTGVNKARADFGVTGDRDGAAAAYSNTDVVIAVLDTGIDAAHADLDGGKVIGWRDEINGRAEPYDDEGHGTHVASIAAGAGEGNTAYSGVAPGAALVGIKVLDHQGSGSTSGIINGINWMITNRATYGIRIANMSLGADGCADGTDPLSTAVNNAVDNGIIMVVAAGNDGPAGCTIGTPAAATQAITVGASYDAGERGWALAEFSSRGPTFDGRIKPDVVAPGRNITAALANSTNGYTVMSGTSMATPLLAGVVGLMLDASYELTDPGIKNILYGAGNYEEWGPSGKDVDYGVGLNLAYNSIRAAGGFTGSYDDRIAHGYASGSLGGAGRSQWWSLPVSSTGAPIAIALIMPGWDAGTPDFDLYLYDPAGRLVARAETVDRQELIRFQPTSAGTYRIRVYSYSGAGGYFLDVSYR